MASFLRRGDARALLAVSAGIALLLVYRATLVEPRAVAAACLGASPPVLLCTPRAALLWLQHWHLWGAAALAAGGVAILGWGGVWLRAAAVGLGAAAVINYNATWGLLGAALGGWAWLLAPYRASAPERPTA